MRYVLPDKNWSTELANIIAQASNGETVVVPNVTIAELGRRACRRMGKILFFQVDQTAAGKFDLSLEMWKEYPNARYSSVSEYGVGMLHSSKPILSEETRSWASGDARGRLAYFYMYLSGPVMDWRESLRERPENI